MFVVKTHVFSPRKNNRKNRKGICAKPKNGKSGRWCSFSKRYNDQVVEPIQGNDLTQTSQHLPLRKFKTTKPKDFQGFSPEKNPLSSHSLNLPEPPKVQLTITTHRKNAQGNKKKHPKKKRIVFKVSISKVSTVSGYMSSHFPHPRTSQVAISIRPKYWPNIDPMHQ